MEWREMRILMLVLQFVLWISFPWNAKYNRSAAIVSRLQSSAVASCAALSLTTRRFSNVHPCSELLCRVEFYNNNGSIVFQYVRRNWSCYWINRIESEKITYTFFIAFTSSLAATKFDLSRCTRFIHVVKTWNRNCITIYSLTFILVRKRMPTTNTDTNWMGTKAIKCSRLEKCNSEFVHRMWDNRFCIEFDTSKFQWKHLFKWPLNLHLMRKFLCVRYTYSSCTHFSHFSISLFFFPSYLVLFNFSE